MNKVKVIPLGDGNGREVNPYEKNADLEILEMYKDFAREHRPLPLLLNNEPFMEKGIVVECEKVFRFKTSDTKWCYITSSSGDDEHEWVYSIITAPVKEEDDPAKKTAKFLIDGFAEQEPVIEAEYDLLMMGDIIKAGDEIKGEDGQFYPIHKALIGDPYYMGHIKETIRRPLKPVKPTVEEMAKERFPIGYVDAASADAIKRAVVNRKQRVAFIDGYTTAEADFKKKALEILEGLRLSLDRFGYNQALNDVKNKIETK